MSTFAEDDIISSAGGDAAGTYSYPKAGQRMPVGEYVLSVMGTWDGNSIEVRVPDRSGNYYVPDDKDGNALTGKTANFGDAVLTLGSAGVQLVLTGSGSQELTVTLEPKG